MSIPPEALAFAFLKVVNPESSVTTRRAVFALRSSVLASRRTLDKAESGSLLAISRVCPAFAAARLDCFRPCPSFRSASPPFFSCAESHMAHTARFGARSPVPNSRNLDLGRAGARISPWRQRAFFRRYINLSGVALNQRCRTRHTEVDGPLQRVARPRFSPGALPAGDAIPRRGAHPTLLW